MPSNSAYNEFSYQISLSDHIPWYRRGNRECFVLRPFRIRVGSELEKSPKNVCSMVLAANHENISVSLDMCSYFSFWDGWILVALDDFRVYRIFCLAYAFLVYCSVDDLLYNLIWYYEVQ